MICLPILLVLTCNSCYLATIKIKNQEWFGDKGKEGAVAFNTLGGKTKRVIPKSTWDSIKVGRDTRFGKLCTDSTTFADIKKNIINLCKATNRCSFEVKKKVDAFFKNVESVNKR